MTRSTYYKFPKRIRDLADEIERVNESWLGSPTRRMVARFDAVERDPGRLAFSRAERNRVVGEAVSFLETARRFDELPALLREYADAWKLVPPLGKGSQHRDLESDQEILLMDLVRSETGKPHLGKVSLLLDAVSSLAGGSKERALDAKALDERHRRYKRSGKASISLDPEGGAAELEFRRFLDPERFATEMKSTSERLEKFFRARQSKRK